MPVILRSEIFKTG